MNGFEIASLFAKVGADMSDFDKSMRGMKDDMTAAERGVQSLQSAIGTGLKIAAAAAAIAITALVAGIGAVTVKAADMEQGVADVGAMMSLTSDETAKLQDHIMELGLDPTLKVSATEASAAVMALGTAGLSVTEILGGASEATVLLANATGLKGGEGLSNAANIATDVMAQFNITAADMKDAVDQIAGTTVASKFTIDDYRLAIAQAGGVAGAVGVTFEDFNAIIAATSPSFASGSDAGTSFKTFLLRLVPDTDKAKIAMQELGLMTDQGGSKFFDAAGKMKSAEEVANLLHTATLGLSDAQKIQMFSTIFGTDAMRTALSLAEGGAPIITAMKKEIGNVDAEELAAKRMDTLKGSWEIFQGVMETLTLSMGFKFIPAARQVIDWAAALAQTYGPPVIEWVGKVSGVLTTAISSIIEASRTGKILNADFAALPLPIQDTIKAAVSFIDTVKTMVTNVVTGVTKFADWNKILTTVTTALPPLWEKLVTVSKAVGDVIEMVKATFTPLADAISKFFGWKDILGAVAVILTGALIGAIGAWLASMAPVIIMVAKVAAVVAALRWAWENDFMQIRTVTQNTLQRISDWFFQESGIWKGSLEKTLDYLKWWGTYGWRDALYNPVVHWIMETTTYLRGRWNQAISDLGDIWNELKFEAQKKWGDFSAAVTHIVGTLLSTIQKEWSDGLAVLKSNVHIELGWLQRYWTDLRDWVVKTYEKMVGDTGQWVKDTFAWFKPAEWLKAGVDLVTGLWDGMKRIWQNVKNWWSGEAPALSEDFARINEEHSPSKVFERHGMNLMAGLRIGISDGTPLVTTAMSSLIDAVAETASDNDLIANPFGTLMTKIADIVSDNDLIANPFGTLMTKITDIVSDNDAIANPFGTLMTKIGATITEGIPAATNAFDALSTSIGNSMSNITSTLTTQINSAMQSVVEGVRYGAGLVNLATADVLAQSLAAETQARAAWERARAAAALAPFINPPPLTGGGALVDPGVDYNAPAPGAIWETLPRMPGSTTPTAPTPGATYTPPPAYVPPSSIGNLLKPFEGIVTPLRDTAIGVINSLRAEINTITPIFRSIGLPAQMAAEFDDMVDILRASIGAVSGNLRDALTGNELKSGFMSLASSLQSTIVAVRAGLRDAPDAAIQALTDMMQDLMTAIAAGGDTAETYAEQHLSAGAKAMAEDAAASLAEVVKQTVPIFADFGAKKMNALLDDLDTRDVRFDSDVVFERLNQFASDAASSLFGKTGQALDADTTNAYHTAQYSGTATSDALLAAVQVLIQKLSGAGLGTTFNLNSAPGNVADNREEMGAVVAYLQALYAT